MPRCGFRQIRPTTRWRSQQRGNGGSGRPPSTVRRCGSKSRSTSTLVSVRPGNREPASRRRTQVVFPNSESADEKRGTEASGHEADIVLRSALRAALHGVQGVCEQLFAELAAQRNQSREAAAAAAEELAAVRAEAQST